MQRTFPHPCSGEKIQGEAGTDEIGNEEGSPVYGDSGSDCGESSSKEKDGDIPSNRAADAAVEVDEMETWISNPFFGPQDQPEAGNSTEMDATESAYQV